MAKHNFFQNNFFQGVANVLESIGKLAQTPITSRTPRQTRRFVQKKFSKQLNLLLQEMAKFRRGMNAKALYWRLWRSVLVSYRQAKHEGFVLPVTVLMVLVVMLVVSSLIFRAYQRSVQTIGDYKVQQVDNAAAPAIERAKAKLEYLLGGGASLGTEIPDEAFLEGILVDPDKEDIYKFEGEELLELNVPTGDTVPAWEFTEDTDGDGEADVKIAYAILLRTSRGTEPYLTMDPKRADLHEGLFEELDEESNETDNDKDDYLVVSNGPLVLETSTNSACEPTQTDDADDDTSAAVSGWFETDTNQSRVRKNFQVYAVAVPIDQSSNPTISTLLYQQDRTLERLNKWGAWFRTDIELYNGPPFDWNGAMHSEGSLFLRGKNGFRSYLISSKNSCYYDPASNSDLSAGKQVARKIPARPASEGSQNGAIEIDIHRGTADPETITLVENPTTNDTQSQDSVDIGGDAIDVALNPLKVHIYNISEYRDEDTWEPTWLADAQETVQERILVEESSDPPYVDDVYRADDLYGPKPAYERPTQDADGTWVVTTDDGAQNGLHIRDDLMLDGDREDQLLRNEPPVGLEDEYGKDGYWERRARGEGLRIIVGQRLELGNTFGWGSGGEDPLNPPDDNTITHEQRQRRTLRDNLASVQATLVYHYGNDDAGYVPDAVIATTVHPGTVDTLKKSATFEMMKIEGFKSGAAVPIIDFFNGYGTNGWEFDPEMLRENITEANLKASTDIGKALQNLAYFAGDLGDINQEEWDGSFPPSQEEGNDAEIHPHPYLTMWGNFSNLRSALYKYYEQGGGIPQLNDQGKISLEDYTTIQSAAATLGMLAYNISYLEALDYEKQDLVEELGEALWKLQDDDDSNGDVLDLDSTTAGIQDSSGNTITPSGVQYSVSPDDYLAALERFKVELDIDDDVIRLARLVMTKEQVTRDRIYGFQESPENHPGNQAVNGIDPYNATLVDSNSPIANQDVYIACNVTKDSGNNYFGLEKPDNDLTEQRFIGLSRLCSHQPKFPSLYYLFPKFDHDHDGKDEEQYNDVTYDHQQPSEEPYITQEYINNPNINNGIEYQTFDLTKIVLEPRTSTTLTDWVLPYETNPTLSTTAKEAAPNNSSQELIKVVKTDGQEELYRIAIKDSALYDGREAMNVRVLNLDLEMLANNSGETHKTEKGNYWVPDSGIVYAFREDAVREDAIARPRNLDWNTYSESMWDARGEAKQETGLMNANLPQDPPLSDNLISPKSIDYYPDPDRRPYGFRLKNGSDISREDIDNGMTFLTDQPVYIQGNFNLHGGQGATENEIEEFTNNGGDFYSRSNPNPNFADLDFDHWRPTEILADAITLLSDNFCDGSIADGIIYPTVDPNKTTQLGKKRREELYGCNQQTDYTSYLNQNRPITALEENDKWVQEDGYSFVVEDDDDPSIPTYPIQISRNGEIMIMDVTADEPIRSYDDPTDDDNYSFLQFSDKEAAGKKLSIPPNDTYVNMVLVSAMMPSRYNQLNGGLHNFPRFLEDWENKTMTIQGSLIQLNFSNYATALYDQTPWEPKTGSPDTSNDTRYYSAPDRVWGYDVGLIKVNPGPISDRLLEISKNRDEFYQEPAADNPYICKLRAALDFPCE